MNVFGGVPGSINMISWIYKCDLLCCVNSDIFNLPVAILWTAVLGEWDREVEENTELRVPIEKVFVHERFHNFQHDIGNNKILI
jgi:hypothetical protein